MPEPAIEPPFVSVVDRAATVIKVETERWGPGQFVSYARALQAAGLLIADGDE